MEITPSGAGPPAFLAFSTWPHTPGCGSHDDSTKFHDFLHVCFTTDPSLLSKTSHCWPQAVTSRLQRGFAEAVVVEIELILRYVAEVLEGLVEPERKMAGD